MATFIAGNVVVLTTAVVYLLRLIRQQRRLEREWLRLEPHARPHRSEQQTVRRAA